MYITKKEYQELKKLKELYGKGKLLTPDGIRLICSAYNYNPEEIGKHFLQLLSSI